MTISTNDLIKKVGATEKTIVSSGASLTDGSFSAASTSYTSTDSQSAPDAKIELSLTFATAPAAGAHVALFVRRLNFETTNDEPVPDASYLPGFIRNVVVDAVTTAQYLAVNIYDLPVEDEVEFYLYNEAGQTISSGWTMKITPLTLGPA